MCCGRRGEEAHRAGPDREHAAGQWESWSGPAVPLGDVTVKCRLGMAAGRGWPRAGTSTCVAVLPSPQDINAHDAGSRCCQCQGTEDSHTGPGCPDAGYLTAVHGLMRLCPDLPTPAHPGPGACSAFMHGYC